MKITVSNQEKIVKLISMKSKILTILQFSSAVKENEIQKIMTKSCLLFM